MVKTRFSAAFIHLCISALVVGSVAAVALFIWYPGLYFDMAGAQEPMLLIIGIDLVIGPLLTLIVYRQGKPSLRFDLTVIACLQIAALAYGTWALSSQRPMFLVFDRGNYEVVSAADIEGKNVPDEAAAGMPFVGPKQVWAAPSEDRALMMSVIIEGADDIFLLPEQYRPITNAISGMKRSGHLVTDAYLAEHSDVAAALTAALNAEGMAIGDALGKRLYPVAGLRAERAALTDPETAELIVMFDAQVPWVRPTLPAADAAE